MQGRRAFRVMDTWPWEKKFYQHSSTNFPRLLSGSPQMLSGNQSVVVEKQLVRVLVGEQDGDDRYARVMLQRPPLRCLTLSVSVHSNNQPTDGRTDGRTRTTLARKVAQSMLQTTTTATATGI